MRWLARSLAVASVLLGTFYLAIVSGQGNEFGLATAFVFGLIVFPGLAGAVGALGAPVGLRGFLLGWSVTGLLAISALSAASIGIVVLPLALGAVTLLILRLGSGGRPMDWLGAFGGGLLGLGLAAGYILALPFLPPLCPSGVTASGHSVYPAGSIYSSQEIDVSWRCDHGHLVSWSHTP